MRDGERIGLAQTQFIQKSPPQGGDKGQRPAAEQDGWLDLAAARQRSHDLVHHRVQHRGGDILAAHLQADQILNIRLGKHPAARSYGVQGHMFFGQAADLGHGDVQQSCHFIDKSPRTPGAGAVHAHIGKAGAGEEDHLGVFAADIDQRAHLWIQLFDHLGGGHHLLNKRDAKAFADPHSSRAGHQRADADIARGSWQHFDDFPQHGLQGG